MYQGFKKVAVPAIIAVTAVTSNHTTGAEMLTEAQMDRVTAGLLNSAFNMNAFFVAGAVAEGATFAGATVEVAEEFALASAAAESLATESAQTSSWSTTKTVGIERTVPQPASSPAPVPEPVRSSPVIRDARGHVSSIRNRPVGRQ
jgi:hypothetical protein